MDHVRQIVNITLCHPERSEGPWFLLALSLLPLQANPKVPRVARDDKCQKSLGNKYQNCALRLSCFHASFASLFVECHQGPSPHAVAQSIPAMAHRNLLRRKDDADRLFRVLGFFVAGALQPLALSEVDRRDGPLRAS